MASVGIGAGRLVASDVIDPKAGIILHKKIGDAVRKGDIILELHSEREDTLANAMERLRHAISISDNAPKLPPLLLKEIL